MNPPCPHCGLPTSRYGAREGQVPHDRCATHGAVSCAAPTLRERLDANWAATKAAILAKYAVAA